MLCTARLRLEKFAERSMAEIRKRKRVPRVTKPMQPIKTHAQFLAMIGRMGKLQVSQARRELKLQQEIQKLKDRDGPDIESYGTEIDAAFREIILYAERNRISITQGGKESKITYRTGKIVWNPESFSVECEPDDDAVITAIENDPRYSEDATLDSFIRRKKEVDREAMRKEENQQLALSIPGVRFARNQTFTVTPHVSGKIKSIKYVLDPKPTTDEKK